MTTVDLPDVARHSSYRPLLSTGTSSLETPASRTAGETARRLATVVAAALAALALVGGLAFVLTGGHWFVVRTPSMGTAAPVGTLVLTRPVGVADLAVGDVVAFHPVSEPALTYTHRVVAVSGGVVTTRGDINGADDPWATTDRQLIGRSVAILPGVGYLARALPLLVIGGLLIVGATRWWLRPDRRGPVQLLGFTALYALASVLIRPFVSLRQLTTTNGPDGATITSSSTGILPVRVSALPGHGTADAVRLSYGEVGTLRFTGTPDDGRYALVAHVDLPWLGWAFLALIWSLPMIWVLVVGFRRHLYPAFETGLGPAAPLAVVSA